jgi:hypothetical protein
MGEYWVCVRGDLTPEQVTELGDAGIAARDLRKSLEGSACRSSGRRCGPASGVSAGDDSEAKATVSAALGVETTDLTTLSAEVWK